jgi:hypothetical protein
MVSNENRALDEGACFAVLQDIAGAGREWCVFEGAHTLAGTFEMNAEALEGRPSIAATMRANGYSSEQCVEVCK